MAAAVAGSVFIALLIIAVPNLHTALQRSRQKRTMSDLRTLAQLIEKGGQPAASRDGWGHPLRIRRAGRHYSIRAAAADGIFESGSPRGAVDGFDSDIVLIDGQFRQTPEGI